MTLAQIVTEINNWLNRSDIADAQIYTFLNAPIKFMEMKYNFRHMKVTYATSLIADAYAFDIPIPKYKSIQSIFIYDSNGYRFPVSKESYEYAIARYPDLTNSKGRPVYLSTIATAETSLDPDAIPTEQFLLRPTCDTSYTLELNGIQYSAELDGDTYTTNWWTQNAWGVLRYAGLEEAAIYIGNETSALLYERKKNEALKDLIDSEILEEIDGGEGIIRNDNASRGEAKPYANDYIG